MEPPDRSEREEKRRRQNREFFERLKARKPEEAAAAMERARRKLGVAPEGASTAPVLESGAPVATPPIQETSRFRDRILETIVRDERPVLFVQDDWINLTEVTIDGAEAQELVTAVDARREQLQPLMPLVGRIDVTNFPGADFVGTGWLVAEDIVVTNRHVASLIARPQGRTFTFSRGVGGQTISSVLCTAHEFDDLEPDTSRRFEVKEVLYIEPDTGPHDIAFLRIARRTPGTRPPFITIATADAAPDTPVLVVGYPARASRRVIPDQDEMQRLYRGRYDVKRAAPGLTMAAADGGCRHDCTTLGGNSGSVMLDLETGSAVGLHFAGLYHETNFAVPASVLRDYLARPRWLSPVVVETGHTAPLAGQPAAPRARADLSLPTRAHRMDPSTAPGTSATITIPLTVTLTVGAPVVGTPMVSTAPAAAPTPTAPSAALPAAADAARAFWRERPGGVVAVRVGFEDEGGRIGDLPLIAASVPAGQLEAVRAAGPASFRGLAIRYYPADLAEQIESLRVEEAVAEIAYDDDARTGEDFSLEPVTETMTLRAHVGPEYSWEGLKQFLEEGDDPVDLVSGIYEFHAGHIAEAIEARLNGGASLMMVVDNATLHAGHAQDGDFDREERFQAWGERFGERFRWLVAPEGKKGLVSNAYHIKVTVRDSEAFWLSSGNWKAGSSQPIITPGQLDDAAHTDLPGNREWHVVVHNETLAGRLANHLRQDFRRSEALGAGREDEAAEIMVDVPGEVLAETIEMERRPPGAVIEPRVFSGKMTVRPLLTPDREGAAYAEVVLELIRSARKSLLFQIPYIGMPSEPGSDRGYIDALIHALTEKLRTLDDARVILRSGGSRLSAPTHAAWHFKAEGVDVASRLRQMEDHHTKGMIVDGRRLLIGSHNWSRPVVSLNRDASLLIEDASVAAYYADAFEVDWARANPIKPRRFMQSESMLLEAIGDAPPPGYRRVRLADLLKDGD